MTVRDFIKALMTDFGALAQGETPNASESVYILDALNTMIDQWNAEGLCTFTLQNAEYDLTPDEDSYTLGTGATLTGGARPARIQAAASISGGFTFDMAVIKVDEYNAIREKDESAKAPRKLYCDYGFPTATLKVWPVPSGACKLQLFTWSPLASFPDLDADMVVPPTYLSAYRYNLTLRVGPGFGAKIDALLATQAVDSKQAMQRYNAETFGINLAPPAAAPDSK